jgi:uncharacterized protein
LISFKTILLIPKPAFLLLIPIFHLSLNRERFMDHKYILKELKELLSQKFGDIVEQVILYGSRAHGAAREYSDYDILIILNTDYDWRKENEILKICNDVNLKYDILIDLKIISRYELLTIKGKQPFIQEAIETGLTS